MLNSKINKKRNTAGENKALEFEDVVISFVLVSLRLI